MRWMIRCLALAHYGWGLALLLFAAWFAASALRVLPHMSSGSILTNLPTVLMVAAMNAGPAALLGAWIVALGRRAWIGHPRLRRALILTHGLLLPAGILASMLGVHALRAASRSAARGGGLLSPVAALPLAFGAPAAILALISLVLAFTVLPKR